MEHKHTSQEELFEVKVQVVYHHNNEPTCVQGNFLLKYFIQRLLLK
jgi:hypothetical protein